MHKFEIHLKSGQTLTWQCKGKKKAKKVLRNLEGIALEPLSSINMPVCLGSKNSNTRVVFLAENVVAVSYKKPTSFKAVSIISGGNFDGVHLAEQGAAMAKEILANINKEKKRQGIRSGSDISEVAEYKLEEETN